MSEPVFFSDRDVHAIASRQNNTFVGYVWTEFGDSTFEVKVRVSCVFFSLLFAFDTNIGLLQPVSWEGRHKASSLSMLQFLLGHSIFAFGSFNLTPMPLCERQFQGSDTLILGGPYLGKLIAPPGALVAFGPSLWASPKSAETVSLRLSAMRWNS